MALKANFNENDIRNGFNRFFEEVEKMQIEVLQELGEMCVRRAREIPAELGFTDRTGNLRSSIGYVVFLNGVAVREYYPQAGGGLEGTRTGANLAKSLGSRFTNGISLVVTAGMNYAIHVESKGRDVLTSAEILAKQELPRMLEELKININKAFE